MRRTEVLVLLILAVSFADAQEGARTSNREHTSAVSRGVPGTPCTEKCDTSETASEHRDRLKQAKREYRKGVKAERQAHALEALQHLETAAGLADKYQSAFAIAREKLVSENIHTATVALLEGRPLEAIAAYQQALELDPKNEFARQQLQAAMPPVRILDPPAIDAVAQEVKLAPTTKSHTFRLMGTPAVVITQVCAAYGIKASIDSSVTGKAFSLALDRVGWSAAISAAMRMSKAFWVPLSEKEVFVAADTESNRTRFERNVMRTFYLPDSIGPQSISELGTALRSLLELRYAIPDQNANSLSVRSTPETIEMVSQLLTELKSRQPQVMLDVEVYQVSSSFLRSFGVRLPTQFQISYIPSSGVANAVTETLAHLQFGTHTLQLVNPSAVITASEARSQAKSLDAVTLRSAQGQPAVLTLGQRYPILTSTYSSVVSSEHLQLPIPNFTYVDVGLRVRATPYIHRDGTIGLQLSVQMSGIGTRDFNGMPEILNSEYNGFVTAMDGEPILAAANVMHSDLKTRSGWPGLSAIPGLGTFFSSPSKQASDDQLLIVIVPHILTAADIS